MDTFDAIIALCCHRFQLLFSRVFQLLQFFVSYFVFPSLKILLSAERSLAPFAFSQFLITRFFLTFSFILSPVRLHRCNCRGFQIFFFNMSYLWWSPSRALIVLKCFDRKDVRVLAADIVNRFAD